MLRAVLGQQDYGAYDDKSNAKPLVAIAVPVSVSITIKPLLATEKFEPAAAQKKLLLRCARLDLSYLGRRAMLRDLSTHVLLNVLTVDAVNYFLEWTACQDQLLACCDPFNIPWVPQLGALAPCGWLVNHSLSYALFAYTHSGTCWERHATLVVAQLVWFFFEMITFSHTYAWERITYYNMSEGHPAKESPFVFGAAEGHPCPERPYFSTWIPIWQDFVYNSVGQLAGWLLFLWMRRRRPGRGCVAHAAPADSDAARPVASR